MSFSALYAALRVVLALIMARARDASAKDVELVVLRHVWGSNTRPMMVHDSDSSPIFVDEAAEDRSPDDVRGFIFVNGVLGSLWAELPAAVGSLRVVVVDVFVEE